MSRHVEVAKYSDVSEQFADSFFGVEVAGRWCQLVHTCNTDETAYLYILRSHQLLQICS